MSNKKQSITTIAKLAGVSPATVSRVVNHPESVKAETLRKVQEVMHEFGYEVNKTPKKEDVDNPIILVIHPGFGNPFFGNVMKGIKVFASALGFTVLVYPERIPHSPMELVSRLREFRNISGIITLSSRLTPQLLEVLDKYAPVIQCYEYTPKTHVPYVCINDYNIARSITNYLLASGRKKIAFINGPLTFNFARERLRGFEASLMLHNVTIPQSWKISLPDISFDIGYSAICQLLSNPSNRPNAIIGVSDVFAVSALRAARRFNMQVPQDLCVFGFDNIDISSLVTPSISSINQPAFQLGYTAASMLIERINDPDTLPLPVQLDAEMILRESCIVLDKHPRNGAEFP